MTDSSDITEVPEPDPAAVTDSPLEMAIDSLHPEFLEVDMRWLAQYIQQAAGVESLSGQLSIVVVADPQMAQMHVDYKQVEGTTDCLTFDLADEDTPLDVVEGELVLCWDEAKRQAQARGHEARLELLLYAVHGLMHLVGEDDLEEEAYAQMHAREDRILRAIGLGDVFARPETSAEDGLEVEASDL